MSKIDNYLFEKEILNSTFTAFLSFRAPGFGCSYWYTVTKIPLDFLGYTPKSTAKARSSNTPKFTFQSSVWLTLILVRLEVERFSKSYSRVGIWRFYECTCSHFYSVVYLFFLEAYNHLRRPNLSGEIVFGLPSTSFPGYSIPF